MLKTISLLTAFAVAATAQQCTPTPNSFTFPAGQYPTIWQKPNTSVFTTAEFQAVNNSINWSMVPNILPKQMDATGNFISTSYPATDPDCWWTYKNCVTPKFPGLKPDTYICPEPETWGYTFDDGPNCTDSQFYDFLQQNNQKATLYYIGSNVADWPLNAQKGFNNGHQICVHTWSHPYLTTLTNDQVLGELYYTRKVIKYVLGVTPLCFRPPFGDVDDRVRAIASQLNMTTDIWDQDTDDWQMIPAGTQPQSFVDGNYQTFITKGQNGSYSTHGTIVLSHELNAGTISEAIKWYPQIKAAYKNVMPVASCMNVSQPYAESNITYPVFAQLAANTSGSSTGNGTGSGSNPSSPSSSKSSSASTLVATVTVGLMIAFGVFAML